MDPEDLMLVPQVKEKILGAQLFTHRSFFLFGLERWVENQPAADHWVETAAGRY